MSGEKNDIIQGWEEGQYVWILKSKLICHMRLRRSREIGIRPLKSIDYRKDLIFFLEAIRAINKFQTRGNIIIFYSENHKYSRNRI